MFVCTKPYSYPKHVVVSCKTPTDLSRNSPLDTPPNCSLWIDDDRPFRFQEILTKYQNVQEFIWCQEEPLNQGAWFSHRHRIQRVLDRLGDGIEVGLVSRPAAAAPAVGLMKLHLQQQKDLVNEAIDK